MNITPTQYVEYGEFIKTLPLPTNMNIVITEHLKGFFIVIFDAKLIFCVLETVFGSNTITVPKIEGREFTKIEFNVIKKLVDIVCAEMERAWEPVYSIRCRYSRSEINPNYITMVSLEETVVICEFAIEVADVVSWMKICMPYGILESIKGYLISTPSREDLEMREKWVQKLRERVKEVPLDIRAVLGKKKISVEEFLRIKKGQRHHHRYGRGWADRHEGREQDQAEGQDGHLQREQSSQNRADSSYRIYAFSFS